MTPLLPKLGLLTIPLALFAGCLEAGAGSEAESSGAVDALAPAVAPQELAWEGYLRVGAADRFAHQAETEPVVSPLAKMGFLLDVPANATQLEFRLAWAAGEEMHLMAHGPMDAGMPTYMSDMATWPTNGEICIAVPPEEILAGEWKVMAHGRETARDLMFTIMATITAPSPARIVEAAHGHQAAGAMMPMEMRTAAPCVDASADA